MTFFTLIKKSLREGKYFYACFVDFRKAYEAEISQSFSAKIGLRLGDVLSTLLFNPCINDIPDFLNQESSSEENQLHILKLDNVFIKNLLFADDLALLS